jgi:hypothetical protein
LAKGGIILPSPLKFDDSSCELAPFDFITKRVLMSISKGNRNALKNGARYLKKEKRKVGGNPLPGEPGGEEYFFITR